MLTPLFPVSIIAIVENKVDPDKDKENQTLDSHLQMMKGWINSFLTEQKTFSN